MTDQAMSGEDLEKAETQARIAKLMAETAKINRETVLYPLVVGASITLAIVAVVKIFLT
ncbi:hypothetical protein MACH17_18480 [Phaeobacter inhibens]|uniref:hypothetical protein n=1 Tax=Phaeobacter inhibens TaxID=221822 RepID=UPI0027447AB9|nr:hypothetical protein [Phaeobacter inhibens]GLO70331.1 hypothetical protein MACH17_18480 [Phaeobacter inhibens]